MGDLDFEVIGRVLPYLAAGLQYTIQLTLVAAAGGVVFGTLLAMARLSASRPLALAAAGYVNLMRSIPLLLVIFWFYFLMPVLLQSLTGAAYFCEIMRAGIQSIAKGQAGAGYALGLNYWQVMRLIVLPQALRNMLPVLLTQAIILFQDVSLVSLLNVTDFVGAAVKVAQRDSRVVEMYLFVAVVYFVLCYSLSAAVKQLQRRIAIVR